jgi:hypothetical protein
LMVAGLPWLTLSRSQGPGLGLDVHEAAVRSAKGKVVPAQGFSSLEDERSPERIGFDEVARAHRRIESGDLDGMLVHFPSRMVVVSGGASCADTFPPMRPAVAAEESVASTRRRDCVDCIRSLLSVAIRCPLAKVAA